MPRRSVQPLVTGLAAGLVAGGLAASGCERSPQETAAASASASVGLIGVSPDYTTLMPPAPDGFEACREDLAVPLTADAGQALLEVFREHPPRPSLVPLAATATRQRGQIAIRAAGRPSLTVSLGDRLDQIEVEPAKLATLLTSEREWSSHYASLLGAILPSSAFVAFAGESPWEGGGLYTDLALRIYAVAVDRDAAAKALRREGSKALELLACALPEEGGHRDAWQFRAREVAEERRLWLSASLFYGDYGGIGTVELRVLPFGEGGALVLACMYEGRERKHCDDLEVASAKLP